MLLTTRLPIFAGAACALAAVLPTSPVRADTFVWSPTTYTYNATTQVGTPGATNASGNVGGNAGAAVNGNQVSILYSTGQYFSNAYATPNTAATNQPSPGVGTNTGNDGTTTKNIYSDGGTNNGTAGTGQQALQILANFDSGTVLAANAGITVTDFFSKTVFGVMFSFWDVYKSVAGSANPYNDIITHSAIQMFALSNLEFTTVPEPSTWALVGVAGIAGAWTLRRRARRMA